MMVGIVDTYLVGHLGAAALSAVGLANQGVLLSTAFFSAVGVGTTALVARHVGAQEPEAANRIAGQSLLLSSVIGLVVAILFFSLAEPIMILLNAPADVVAPGTTYLQVVAPSFFMAALMFVGMAAMRGAGDTRTPMVVMGVVNALNIVVAYACIYGLGPIPTLGVAGSAIGAAMGRGIGGLVILSLLIRGNSGLRLSLSGLRPDLAQVGRILNIGLPAGMEMLSMRFGQTVYAVVVAGLGTAAFAAHQVALTSESLAFMPGFGFGVAATTLVGQGLGAKDPRFAEESGYISQRLAMLVMSAIGVIFFILASQLIGLFTNDPEVIALGIWPLRLVAFSQPALATAMVLAGGLRGAGDTRTTFLITTLGFWLLRIPLAIWLVQGYGLIGAWIAMGVDLNVRGLTIWLRFRSGVWKAIKV